MNERRGHGSAVGRGERTARWIVPVHGDRDSGKSSVGICLQRCCTEFTYRANNCTEREMRRWRTERALRHNF